MKTRISNRQSAIGNLQSSIQGGMMEAVALHAAHAHNEEEYTTTGIPHDKMGMWVFLCSEVMFFTGLIGSYIVLRFATPLWPPPASILNIPLTAANTFILICSSVTMVQALAAISRGDTRKLKLFLCLTLLGGTIFLSIQAVEYWKLLHAVSYTHLRAHETRHDLVCRLLLEKK